MKTLLFILSFVVIATLAYAKDVRTLDNLKQNDWFALKITIPAGTGTTNNISLWDYEDVHKINITCRVISATKDSIRLAVKTTNWFACYTDSAHKGKYKAQSYVYLDTYFYIWNEPKYEDFFEKDSTIVTINLKSQEIRLSYAGSGKEWYSGALDFPKGLKFFDFETSLPDVTLDFANILQISFNRFIQEWNKKGIENKPVPCIITLKETNKPVTNRPIFIQVLSASFDLSPNTHILFEAPDNMPQDRVFIQMNNEIIKPSQQINGTYIFNFFLHSPQRARIGNVLLSLTPEDSISIKYNNQTQNFNFSGKGSENNTCFNEMAKFYDENTGLSRNQQDLPSCQEIENHFNRIEKEYNVILNKYIDKMDKYWFRSANLSYNYWYASEKIDLNNKATQLYRNKDVPEQYQIPWSGKEFMSLFPYTDYLYQPYTYHDFINNFFNYKAQEAGNSLLTGFKYFKSYIPRYYFSDLIFWGYPKAYLTGAILQDLMKNYHLSHIQREYNDFLDNCYEPEIRKTIINLHQQLSMIEPGANIKGLNLKIQNNFQLKNKADGYIIALVLDTLSNSGDQYFEQRFKAIQDEMNDANLTDKIKICIITSELQKTLFDARPDMQKVITFVPDDQLRDYYDKVLCKKGHFIIMKNDGTILSRNSVRGDYEAWHINRFLLDEIKQDIENQEKQNTVSNNILSTTIVSSILSIILAFLIARVFVRRKERIRRQFLELELKAFRAQMNPHFTFNALSSIQNLINQKKDKEANEYLVNFARLLRLVLSSSDKKLVPLSEEIEQLELFLRLEQLRTPFEYTIEIGDKIDTETEEIPGMLIQPILENAVKHGIIPNKGGLIKLSFSLTDKHILNVSVSDTGPGYKEPEDSSKKGFGLKAVQERLRLLNKEFKFHIGLKIENMEVDNKITGCIVTLSIPV